jgi:Tannase and feruloyl esterase
MQAFGPFALALLLSAAASSAGCSNSASSGGAGGSGAAGDSGTAGNGAAGFAATRAFCGAVLAQTVTGVTLTEARLVPATASNPIHCLVGGTLAGSIKFRVALPDNWNHKLLFIGGGGFDGEIPDVGVTFSGSLATGYAIVADDSGHQGSGAVDASFALDEAKLMAFGNSSTHLVLPAARAIVSLRYGSSATQAYFEGCSNGGREALIEAQRWPDDFDGIIARAPAYDFTGSMTAFHRIALLVNAAGGTLTNGKLKTLANAELSACDADDGVRDGIIAKPEACDFDATALRCTGASDDSCLTDAELATVSGIRSETPLPYTHADSLLASPGWLLGHEGDLLWSDWTMGNPAPSIQFLFQDQFIKYFVTKNPNQDSLQTSLEDYASALSKLSLLLDATNPDLSQFSEHGGKLLLWHGLADPALSPVGSVEYYLKAVAQAGSQAKADEFLRFFRAPGVYHCFRGPGADAVDLVGALDAWVTAGTPPENLIATHVASFAGDVSLTRPLCAYPSYARYSGAGDASDAANFACETP